MTALTQGVAVACSRCRKKGQFYTTVQPKVVYPEVEEPTIVVQFRQTVVVGIKGLNRVFYSGEMGVLPFSVAKALLLENDPSILIPTYTEAFNAYLSS